MHNIADKIYAQRNPDLTGNGLSPEMRFVFRIARQGKAGRYKLSLDDFQPRRLMSWLQKTVCTVWSF